MKVFVAVLSLAAAAAAGVIVDQPAVEHANVGHAVEPMVGVAERQAVDKAFEEALMKMEASARMITLYSSPTVSGLRTQVMGGMERMLEKPVMVAFKDEDKLHAFLLPGGFKDLKSYKDGEARHLLKFLTNGNKKAFLDLSAGDYLDLPEMTTPIPELHLLHYNLHSGLAFRSGENVFPIPYLLIVDVDSIKDIARFAKLKEMGVFSMEKEGLKIVHDNFPVFSLAELDLIRKMNLKNVDSILPIAEKQTLAELLKDFQIRDYIMPTTAEKDLLIRKYFPVDYKKATIVEKEPITDFIKSIIAEKQVKDLIKPVVVEKDLIRGYIQPTYTQQGVIRQYIPSDYIKSTIAEKDPIRDYIKPTIAEQGVIRKYVPADFFKSTIAEKDMIRDYIKPTYVEEDLFRDYVKPTYSEEDLIRDFKPAFSTSTDFIRGYAKPITAEREFIRDFVAPTYVEKGEIRDFTKPIYI